MPFILRAPGSRIVTLIEEETLPQRITGTPAGTYEIGRAAIDWMDGTLTVSASVEAPYIVTPMAFVSGPRMVGDVVELDIGEAGGAEPIVRDLVIIDAAGLLPSASVTTAEGRIYAIQTRAAGLLTATLDLTGPEETAGPQQTVTAAIALHPPVITFDPPAPAPGAGVLLHWSSPSASSISVIIDGVGTLTGSGSPLLFDAPGASGTYSWSATATDGAETSAAASGSLVVHAAGDWAFGSITTSGFEIVGAPPQPPLPVVSGITDTGATFAAGTDIGDPLEVYMVQPAAADELDGTHVTFVTGREVDGYADATLWRVRRLSGEVAFSTTGALEFLDNFSGTGQALGGSVSDSGHAWVGTGTIRRDTAGWLVIAATPASAVLGVPPLADFTAELVYIARTTTVQAWSWRFRVSENGLSYLELLFERNGSSVKLTVRESVAGVVTQSHVVSALSAYSSTIANRFIDIRAEGDQFTVSYRASAADTPTEIVTWTVATVAAGKVQVAASGTASANSNAGIHIAKLTIEEIL